MASGQELLSQTEFAELIGKSQPMVHKYIRQGKIPKACIVQDGKYKKIKVAPAIKALNLNLDPGRRQPATPNISQDKNSVVDKSGLGKGLSFAEAQRLDKIYSAALKKLDHDEKSGKLVDSETIQATAFRLARTVRDAIMNIPDRISSMLAAESDPIACSKILTDELVQALDELSSER